MKIAQVGLMLTVGAAALLVPAGNTMLGAGRASADTIYTLNLANSGLPFTGPYASADVHLIDSTHATVSFTSDTTGGITFLMAGQGAAGVNVNAASWTLSNITFTQLPGFTTSILSNGGAGNEDGFGSFNQRITGFDGYTHADTGISFELTDTSGTWADSASVLTPNASGHSVAIHGFACTAPCTASEGALSTGFATDGGTTPPNRVPEPSTILMLGSGFLGFAAFRRFRK
jgi:PEP-CTERM motif-containing protein